MLVADMSHPGLSVGLTEPDPSAGLQYRAMRLSTFLERTGALAAINASYFLPFAGGSDGGDDYIPQEFAAAEVSGAVYVDGETVSPVDWETDRRVEAIICFEPGHAVLVAGQICPDGFASGLSSGPHLIENGEAKTPRQRPGQPEADPAVPGPGGPRTAIGLADNGTRLIMVVADGRQPGYSQGMNHAALIELFQAYGAHDAMSLDGGGSSTMGVRGETGPVIMNRPIHTRVPGRERPLGNHIAIFAVSE
ncbi:hypothetical protein GCM10007417_26400 [Glycocaulis alkaliphilus]|nr:hypothetical protein GCM10007417_26400 [Glycocaulis alkaliphilus]